MRVLIDTDPGLGQENADVDDGLALFLMLNNPKFEIEGITTVFGNTRVKKGYELLKKYLDLSGNSSIPNKIGAKNYRKLGKPTEASEFLIQKVKEHPNELTLITLGPFTNISTALMEFPAFFDDLKEIVIMAGLLSPIFLVNKHFIKLYEKTPLQQVLCEFNSYRDPQATKIALEAKTQTPRIQMGLEVCCKVIITQDHVREIESINKPIPQFIVKDLWSWIKLQETFLGLKGFFPYDTLVPIYLLEPELFKSIDLFLEIDTENIPGKYSIRKSEKDSTPISYCFDFKNENAKDRFLDLLISNLIK
ncbi:MAG: nucleoside hydrolase [Promethearchaeota archaeon]|nr:MAG: nucleoside hydrolase [Candidatus Lokiarchaeota archaeon]